MPQSQTAANPWHEKEEKWTNINVSKINKEMHEKQTAYDSSVFPRRGDYNAKQDNTRTKSKTRLNTKHPL